MDARPKIYPTGPGRGFRRTLLLLLCLLVPGLPAIAAGDRVALVIGNSQYRKLNALANPTNDAQAVAARLSAHGFKLIGADGQIAGAAVYDLDEDALVKAIKAFAMTAGRSEIAFFYYAGHGMQIDGESYLLPVDVEATDVDVLERNSVSLNQALRWLDGRAELTVAVFDACRDIPALADALRQTAPGFRFGARAGNLRGLQRVQQGPGGRVVAFSGGAGEPVADGQSGHSPYTGILLEHIDEPGTDVLKVFRAVANDFTRRYGQQAPEVLTQGVVEDGRYCLTGPCPGNAPPAAEPTPAPGPATVIDSEAVKAMKEMQAWSFAQGRNDCEGYQDFLVLFPSSVFARLATQKTERLCDAAAPPAPAPAQTYQTPPVQPPPPPVPVDPDEVAWQSAQRGGDCQSYLEYYRSFSDGKHAEEARALLVKCVEEAMQQRALAFVDGYYGSLGRASCDTLAAMWVAAPPRLCALIEDAAGFQVRDKRLVSMSAQEAMVFVAVEGATRGEQSKPWQGCLDLAWSGDDWKLVRQHAEDSGPCAGDWSQTDAPSPTPDPGDGQDREAALSFADRYYAALNDSDYKAVASLWDPGKRPGRLRGLVENVEWIRIDAKELVSLDADHAGVAVAVTGKAKDDATERSYRMYLELVRRGGDWKLVKMRKL